VKNKKDIEQILSRVDNLPPLPAVADEALRILNDNNSSKNDVVKIVSREQSFIAKILAIANSPIYGLRKEVSTLSFAVFVLGLKEIKKAVFALAFVKSFQMEKDKYFNPESFWVHSFVVGNLSRKIAMDLDLMNSGEAFISGFLHDFSISLLHREFKAEFVEIYKLVETGVSFDSAEKEILGVTHSEIAKSVLGKWDLPDILIDTVSNHHTPSLSERDKRLTSIVHLADYITSKLDVASCTPDNKFELDESIIETLHFSNEESLNEFIESYREYISEQIDSIRNLL
jgi:HD-like signal output (HDOD) protein